MSFRLKLASVMVALALGMTAAAVYVLGWLTYIQPPHQATTTASSSAVPQAHLRLATVGTIDYGPHPDWVSYLTWEHGKWVHTTNEVVPAHAIVHVTIDEYDGQTGLRNPWLGQIRGTIGNVEYINGRPVRYLNPDTAAHTFSIPEYGVNVPLYGIPNTSYPGDLTNPHNFHETITFSFKTGAPGLVHWQCFVPCAAGYLFGNGGPMQTIGYMDGYLHVVAK